MPLFLLAARLALAVVFLVAGAAKLADREGTRRAAADFGLPGSLAPPLAVLLPLAELVVAAALTPAVTAWWGAIGATALLLAFTAAIGANLALGRRPDCHCFGQLHSAPAGWPTLARNIVLAALAGWLAWRGPGRVGPDPGAWLVTLSDVELVALLAAALVLALAGLGAWLALHLLRQNGRLLVRLEALEARLAGAAAPTAGPPASGPAPDFRLPALAGGEVDLAGLRAPGAPLLLAFVDPGCGPCAALLPDFQRWERERSGTLALAVVSRGAPGPNRAKFGGLARTPVLLQRDREVAEAYDCGGTPSAVLVRPDGRTAGPPAMGADAIRALVASMPLPPLGIGDPVPPVAVTDLDGRPLSLPERLPAGPTLLLFWNPACGFCEQLLPDLRAWEASAPAGAPGLVVVSTGPPERNRALGLRSPVLLDQDFEVGRRFGAAGTPSGVLLDAGRRVASRVAAGGPAVLVLAGAAPAEPAVVAA